MVLAVVGCSSGALDDAGSWDDLISRLCAEFESCCTAAERPVDGAECRAHYSALAPASAYDQAKADACLQEIAARGADKCAWISRATPSCERVFAGGGTAKPGEPCQHSSDCALSAEGQARCVRTVVDDAVVVQQCQLLLPGVESSYPCVGDVKGDRTNFFGDRDTPPNEGYLCDVADGLTCNRNIGANSTGACETLRAVGEPCNLIGTADCISSAYCDFIDDTCKDRLPLGAECWNDDSCEATAYCQLSDRTCAARQAHGTPCTTDAECLANRCLAQTCGPANDFALTFLCGPS
jgi:hypothetical protein